MVSAKLALPERPPQRQGSAAGIWQPPYFLWLQLFGPSPLGLTLLPRKWYFFCEPQVKLPLLLRRSDNIRRLSTDEIQREGRLPGPGWEASFSGTLEDSLTEEKTAWQQESLERVEKGFSTAPSKMCLHWQYRLLIKTCVSKKKSISEVPLTLMGSKRGLNCAGPQNSSRQRNSPAQQSTALRSSPRQHEQGKERRPRDGAGGRERSSHPTKNSRGKIMKKQYTKKTCCRSAAPCICLFTGFPLGNGSKCSKM